ncbi:hypothetical protein D3C86_605130 [compost metagenome]
MVHKLVDGHGDLLLFGGIGGFFPVTSQQLGHGDHKRDVRSGDRQLQVVPAGVDAQAQRKILAAHCHDGHLHSAILVEDDARVVELARLRDQMSQQDCLAGARLPDDGRVAEPALAGLVDILQRSMKVQVIGRAACSLEHRDRRPPGIARRLSEEVVVHRREAQEVQRGNRCRARSPFPVPRELCCPRRHGGAVAQSANDLFVSQRAADARGRPKGLLAVFAEHLDGGVVVAHDEAASGELITRPVQVRDL